MERVPAIGPVGAIARNRENPVRRGNQAEGGYSMKPAVSTGMTESAGSSTTS
jgi:hypothetical protein